MQIKYGILHWGPCIVKTQIDQKTIDQFLSVVGDLKLIRPKNIFEVTDQYMEPANNCDVSSVPKNDENKEASE